MGARSISFVVHAAMFDGSIWTVFDLHSFSGVSVAVVSDLKNSGKAIVDWVQWQDGPTYSIWAPLFGVNQFFPFGQSKTVNLLLQKDIADQLFWNSVPSALYYRVYDQEFDILFQGSDLSFVVHGAKKKPRIYYVSWTGPQGESNLVPVSFN